MRLFLTGLAAWVFFVRGAAWADDWPTARHDARRSGTCQQALPDVLHPQWTLPLRPTLLAWPNEPRLHFDAWYEPVVAARRMLVGSPNDGSVTAYDADSGKLLWRFFTEGPVRFAPAITGAKVFAASDDGYLYCLNLADGTLRSRIRGAPADRPDERHLGNGRLISFWPARGGPVIADGTAYFAAGVWPTLGVFVLAVDVDKESVVWRNDRLGHVEKVRLDHNHLDSSGLSPQGCLAVADDLLLVPNGRSMPAALDRQTGQLRWYVQGYRNGECLLAVSWPYAMVGQQGVVDLRTGREVGSRWLAAGADAPQQFDAKKFHLFEGPIHAYKMFNGCSARTALDPTVAYDFDGRRVVARDLAAAKLNEYESKSTATGYVLHPWRWDPPVLWELPLNVPEKVRDSAILRAGTHVFVHAGNRLFSIALPDRDGSKPRVVWQTDLPGTPARLLAAEGKLFAVTREGSIACFGPQAGEPIVHKRPAVVQPHPKRGYAVVLGLESRFLLELQLRGGAMKVIGVDADRERVERLRVEFAESGRYGGDVELFVGDPLEFRLPSYLATKLTLSEGLKPSPQQWQRLFQTLRPYGGGLLALGLAESDLAGLWPDGKRPDGVKTEADAAGVWLQRSGPLPGSAAWTHECSDAARSYFSHDGLVKPPLGVLWYGDGPGYGFWKEKDYGTGVKPQVVGGRLLALQISSNTLVAYDVYTGLQLWTAKVPPFTRYASLDDGIYAAGGNEVTVFDPASGKVKHRWKLSIGSEAPAVVSDVRVGDDIVLVAAAAEKVRAIEKGLWDSTSLIALDRRTGKRLWKRDARQRFNNHAIAIGGGRVYCVDSPAAAAVDKRVRTDDAPKELVSTVVALDARSGKTVWSHEISYPCKALASSWLGMRTNDDWLAYAGEPGVLLAGKYQRATAYDAADGKEAWSAPVGPQPMILRGDTFINQAAQVYDTRTGKLVAGDVKITRGGCNYGVANEHLLFLRDRSVTMIDLDRQSKHSLYAIRSGCSNSLVAADGLLNVPNFAVGCVCNYPIQTSFAMLHMPDCAAWSVAPPQSIRAPKTPSTKSKSK